jgi:hypothetical protein
MNALTKVLMYGTLAGILYGGAQPAHAATAAPSTVYATIGPITLPVPWDLMNAVYLYNVTAKKNQVGGEMTFAQVKAGSYKGNAVDIDLTAGGVLVPETNAVGTGFAGLSLAIPNPLPALSTLGGIQPGIFGGYAINQHQWQFGIKAAFNIFNGAS